MTRHCTRCGTDVEDAGGFCLLGHPLRESLETASLADLKDEVEAAFASAQDEVRNSLTPLIEQVEAVAPRRPESELATVGAPAPAAETAAFVGPERSTPPPPPPSRPQSKVGQLWAGMDETRPLDRDDPINAFAPPPRMDWGPQRSKGRGRSLRRLRASNA